MMTIGIDCRMLGQGYGLGRHIEQLIKHLQAIDTGNQYVLFFRKDNWESFEPSGSHMRKVLADIPWYGWKEQLLFKKVIQKEHVDLMHFPHWNVPLLYNDPFVVTIHDLIMFHYPRPEATTRGRALFWIKDKVHRLVVRHAARVAKCIMTTSEFTKHDLNKTLGVPLEKMTTIYQAPFQKSEKRKAKSEKDILGAYHITKPYVLYVGAAYPHKNLERLVEAWQLFEAAHPGEYELVLVGKEDYFYKRLASRIPKDASIMLTGFVPDDDLSVLYEEASLYVFPSLYEGFGLSPLEAMAHGVPVAASSASCLPEVLGDAALFMDPKSPEHMATTIYRGLTDGDTRFLLKQAAQSCLRRYSWDDFAKKTSNLYMDANK